MSARAAEVVRFIDCQLAFVSVDMFGSWCDGCGEWTDPLGRWQAVDGRCGHRECLMAAKECGGFRESFSAPP